MSIFDSRDDRALVRFRDSTGGRTGGDSGFVPNFIASFNDLGAGQVNTVASIFGGTLAGTFTRATTAWTKLFNGLWASIASGTARSTYTSFDTTIGQYAGYFTEGVRINSCLQARDLSNASWTKTTATGLADQVGIDGVANSASSLLATAGAATVTQAITLASAAKTFSVWIKRITGTGTIQISLDNFATNTDVTSLINGSTYTQVTMTQTLANPTVGIKIVTNADKIAVDMAQLEDGASLASSPIPTTTVSVTRNSDSLVYVLSGGTSGTLITQWINNKVNSGTFQQIISIDDGTGNQRIFLSENGAGALRRQVNDGGIAQYNTTAGVLVSGTSNKAAITYSVGDFNSALNGTLGTSGTSGTVPATTTLRFGDQPGGGQPLFGTIFNASYYAQQRLSNDTFQNLTR